METIENTRLGICMVSVTGTAI